MTPRPQNLYDRYHAHVYFSAQTLSKATQLCQLAGDTLKIEVGRIHEKLVGPHPHWSCQLTFNRAQFDSVISWLETHREGLNILVHGLTGDDLADHTEHASWLGTPSPLKLDIFNK